MVNDEKKSKEKGKLEFIDDQLGENKTGHFENLSKEKKSDCGGACNDGNKR